MAAKKPAAEAAPKPAAKKPAAEAPSDATLLADAESAEHELQATIAAAAVTGWEPVHAERCAELAAVSSEARKKLGLDVPGHVARFV